MRKNFFKIMLTLVMIISFSLVAMPAHATSGNGGVGDKTTKLVNERNLNSNIYEYKKLSTTYGWPWEAITKTVYREYLSPDVPAAIHYTEYIDGKWYSGTLKLTGTVESIGSGFWRATYTGKINY